MAQRHEISLLMFENITKHVKITCYLHVWRYHVSDKGSLGISLVFFFNRERILHGSTEVKNFSSSVEKYFTSEQRKQEKYLSTQDEKCRTSKQP